MFSYISVQKKREQRQFGGVFPDTNLWKPGCFLFWPPSHDFRTDRFMSKVPPAIWSIVTLLLDRHVIQAYGVCRILHATTAKTDCCCTDTKRYPMMTPVKASRLHVIWVTKPPSSVAVDVPFLACCSAAASLASYILITSTWKQVTHSYLYWKRSPGRKKTRQHAEKKKIPW